MRKVVDCPRCGTENPHSPIITVCKECKGSLSGAAPRDAGPDTPARAAAPAPMSSPAPRSPEPDASVPASSAAEPATDTLPPTSAPPPTDQVTTAAPTTQETATRLPPSAPPERTVTCRHCGHANPLEARICDRCGRLIPEAHRVGRLRLQPCPRCGRVQDRRRRTCYHCGLPYAGPDGQATVPVDRQLVARVPPNPAKGMTLFIGCIWAGMLLPLVAWFIIVLLKR